MIFGAGIRGSLFALLLQRFGYSDILFTDNNSEKWGGLVCGAAIVPPAHLEKIHGEAIILISIEGGDLIKEQLEGLGFTSEEDYFFLKTDVYENYLSEMKRPAPTRTLIVGDCGLSQIAINDQDRENLAAMFKDEFGIEKTKVLAMHGMGMRSFYHVIKTQLQLDATIENLIIMLNFEVFTGKHHLLPRTQHSELIQKICELSEDSDDELKKYVEMVIERSSKLVLDVASQGNGSQADEINNAKLILMMNYMYKIRENTEDMVYLFKILELAKESNLNVLPYIPPANYMYAQEIVGDKFKVKYEYNISSIKKWVSEHGYKILDMSYLMTADSFADIKTIDETANASGRLMILEEIKSNAANFGISL